MHPRPAGEPPRTQLLPPPGTLAVTARNADPAKTTPHVELLRNCARRIRRPLDHRHRRSTSGPALATAVAASRTARVEVCNGTPRKFMGNVPHLCGTRGRNQWWRPEMGFSGALAGA
jgi:hypothetical protein